MSDYDNGFARAQRAYDNQLPPEYDIPDADQGKIKIAGTVIDTPYYREKLELINAFGIEIIGDNDSGQDIISFSIETDKDDLKATEREYEHIKRVLRSIDADLETDEIIESWTDNSEPDDSFFED